ncbi:MAG: hypothetical protein AAGA36_00415 [Pseudomonadota bacterium]
MTVKLYTQAEMDAAVEGELTSAVQYLYARAKEFVDLGEAHFGAGYGFAALDIQLKKHRKQASDG